MDKNELFESIIFDYSEEIKEIARGVRNEFYKVFPDVDETIWVKQGTVGYGVGPKKMSEHFGWIMIAKKHVNMGFNYGSILPDPDELLEGTGKNMRHIKIRALSELSKLGVKKLILSAINERKAFLKL